MKFSCEKALLSSAVATPSRAVAIKSSIPAMEGYNLETGIQATVPAEIQEPGSLVLSARLFGEIIRKMPDDVVVFTANNYMVNIKCGLSEFNILGTDPEEFPELPTVDQQNSLTMEQSTLRSMISQTLFAVSDNESRPIHTGSLFEVDQTGLTLVSVDGYRLALRREAVEKIEGAESFSFVVPGSPLRCVFGDGLVSITTKTGIGDAADQCPITGDGQELEIGFNNKYLMDALKAAPADRLRLEFSSGVAPCVILPAEGEENFIYMVRCGQQLETGLESEKVLWRKQPFRSAQSSSSFRIC